MNRKDTALSKFIKTYTCINASNPPSGLSMLPDIGAFRTRCLNNSALEDKLI